MFTHGSLFSGIGGFDLAAQWMGWENVFHCEKEPFCQKILKRHFPNSILYEDIKTADFTIRRGKIDVLTGGFPCQPFSTSGKRKGTDDDRYLWPEMLRAVREIQPRWIVGENVRGLTNWNGGMVFDQVQVDLEAECYEVLPFLLPACAVNAPHRRDRIWFIAHSNGNGYGSNNGFGENRQAESQDKGNEKKRQRVRDEFGRTYAKGIATNPKSVNEREPTDEINTIAESREARSEFSSRSEFVTDPDSGERCKGRLYEEGPGAATGYISTFDSWTDERDTWNDFPTQSPICGRNDGIPNRVDRIKALGNAVVPQLVFQIFKAIQQYESNNPSRPLLR